jgi:hypothetical protein
LPKDICPQKKEFLYNAVSRFMSTLEYYKNKKSSLGSLDINKATSTYPPVLQIMEANGVWDVLEDWEERAGQDIVHDVILALVYGMSGRLSYEAGCLQYKSLNKSLQDLPLMKTTKLIFSRESLCMQGKRPSYAMP